MLLSSRVSECANERRLVHQLAQIAKTIGSISTRHRSDATVSDQCLIDVDPKVCAICETAEESHLRRTSKRQEKVLVGSRDQLTFEKNS